MTRYVLLSHDLADSEDIEFRLLADDEGVTVSLPDLAVECFLNEGDVEIVREALTAWLSEVAR